MQRNVLVSRLILAVAVLAVIVLILVGAMAVRDRFFGTGEVQLGQTVQIPAEAQTVVFNDTLAYIDGGKLVDIGPNGETLFSVDVADPNAQLGVAGTRLVLYQNQEAKIYLEDGQEYFTKPLNMNVSMMRCGNECMAFLNETKDRIYVLSKIGSLQDEIVLTGQTVINFGFYSTNELLWVISVDSNGSSASSSVNIYEPGKSTLAMKSFSNEIAYQLIANPYTSTALAVGTKNVTLINLSSNAVEDYSALVYGYQYVSSVATSSQYAVLLAPTDEVLEQSISTLRVVNASSAKNIELPAPCQVVVAKEKYIYAANVSNVYTLDYDGVVVSKLDLTDLYASVKAVDDDYLLFYKADNAARVVQLP